LCAAKGNAIAPARQAEIERWLRRARQALSTETAAAAWAMGQTMPLADAVAQALTEAEPVAPVSPPAESARPRPPALLTRREQEVAAYLARGFTNRQIAAALSIAERTAERHVENILLKLDFTSRTQVAVWATERGLTAVTAADE
jgi:DNA-binding NarL/FixJ family response regulator